VFTNNAGMSDEYCITVSSPPFFASSSWGFTCSSFLDLLILGRLSLRTFIFCAVCHHSTPSMFNTNKYYLKLYKFLIGEMGDCEKIGLLAILGSWER
jgi:hypothetical protein